jgi:hypothetical protein
MNVLRPRLPKPWRRARRNEDAWRQTGLVVGKDQKANGGMDATCKLELARLSGRSLIALVPGQSIKTPSAPAYFINNNWYSMIAGSLE